MKLVNESNFHLVIFNGKSYERIEPKGVSSELDDKIAYEQAEKFKPSLKTFLDKKEDKKEERKDFFKTNKKEPKKGTDKKLPKIED